MTHGEDQGLRLPPQIAPVQAVVVPIYRKEGERELVSSFVDKVREVLKGKVRLEVDDRDQFTPGWKYNEHELRGVPVRIEVGPRDVGKNAVMSVRRDNRAKESIALDQLAERLPALLAEVQQALFDSAAEFRAQNTVHASSLAEVQAHFAERRGFVSLPWNDDDALEAEIKAKTGATLRCIPLDQSAFSDASGGKKVALFAKSY